MSEEDREIEEIAESLEQSTQEQEDYNVWQKAYDEWEENGDHSMLENLLHQQGMTHQLDTMQKLKKKSEHLDYDKFDTGLISTILTSSWFIIDPVIISLWLTVAGKILWDSYRDMDWTGNRWEKIDSFGPELLYYISFSLATVYFFITVQGNGIVWSNGGTLTYITVSGLDLLREVVLHG